MGEPRASLLKESHCATETKYEQRNQFQLINCQYNLAQEYISVCHASLDLICGGKTPLHK